MHSKSDGKASATAGAAWYDQLAVALATRRQRNVRLAWLREVVRNAVPAPPPIRFA